MSGAAAKIAKVAVSGVAYSIDHTYDYSVPQLVSETLEAGMRIIVPFGRANKRTEAMVLELVTDDGSRRMRELKPVMMVLDSEPVLSGELIRLALWMRERCFCTFYEAARAMLPAGINYSVKDKYFLGEGVTPEAAAAAAADEREAQLLRFAEKGFLITQAESIPRAAVLLRGLEKRGLIRREVSAERGVGDRTVAVYSLAVSEEDARAYIDKKAARYPARCAVLECVLTRGTLAEGEISYFTGESAAVMRGLVKSGLLAKDKREVYRRPEYSDDAPVPRFELTVEQRAAADRLCEMMLAPEPHAALLYGVTGSGKTQVYLDVIEKTLENGRGAMVLAPEIALTPQLMRIFRSRFGDRVAVLHSALSSGERADEWKRIRAGEADVVLGTRSAVFAPVRSLGVIVIDEEQERSYKSDNTPRYHARDIARWRCARSGALLVLGSATPSVESFRAAEEGRYELLRLPTRFAGRALPAVEMADMRDEIKRGNSGSISSLLALRIRETLDTGGQAILLLNRRGAARMRICVECGHTPECTNCSMPMTYHSANGRMMCHYCGASRVPDTECPECGGEYKLVGAGTQSCEDELNELFPQARILRMDSDTTSPRRAHEEILGRFRRGDADILLGTQMVAKGLDFPNVTLVGVISADQSLYAADFRAHEQTFSLITQVVGRAGRGEREGRAVVQSFVPLDSVLTSAARQDYEGFYSDEIRLRRALRLPPFRELITLTCADTDEMRAFRCAVRARDMLRGMAQNENLDVEILGPAQAPIYKINGRYRTQLTLNCGGGRRERLAIAACIKACRADKAHGDCIIFADIE